MLTVTDWAALEDAYGNARDVPILLAAAEQASDETGIEWNELWSRLCHQGTVYSASYAALPELATMAGRHAPAGYVAALQLAASIVASEDGPKQPADVRTENADDLAEMRDLAESNLPFADDDTEFIYGLKALMSFEDGGVWQRCLDHVADGEMPLACPACGETLILDLSGEEFVLGNYDDSSVPVTAVELGHAGPGTVEERLLLLATAQGRHDLANKVQHLFGDVDCPSCGHHFIVAHALY